MNYLTKTRVEAFSDGVFAIIVTLLVLEIKVPHIEQHESVAELGTALLGLLPKILSWIISFLIVCVIWVNHHRILAQVEHITHGLFWLNALLLLWCSFIPFPTALMGDYLGNPLASFVFGCILALMALTFSLIRWYALRNQQVLKKTVDLSHYRRATTRSVVFGPSLYLLGGALAFVHTWLSMAVFAFIPLYFIVYSAASSVQSADE
ncbi:Transmembrane protein 175 [Fibrella aestuarina BUZ 2]|uniref:Transmembrane protein 175 n=1 Tax=Fibrella aestuarina BUZ 2 TaxID=1166018 RepID=I0K9D5_9BACT|nr:TMEM175 family protein [Fibrella aestuarina]CCH00738.1 Transmembrane protein 175 [Fibrella aestuarina BUZ 2]